MANGVEQPGRDAEGVEILTDPGGSVLLLGEQPGRDAEGVEILTDPGGSVLRSSPARVGRCCPA
ncbi:hypothetical protein [Actinokineospora sp. NPDC004072]